MHSLVSGLEHFSVLHFSVLSSPSVAAHGRAKSSAFQKTETIGCMLRSLLPAWQIHFPPFSSFILGCG